MFLRLLLLTSLRLYPRNIMIQHIDESSFKRRMSDVGIDLFGIKPNIRSRFIMPLVKRLMLSTVEDTSSKHVVEVRNYAKTVLNKPLNECTYVNEIAVGRNDFRPISVAKIVCTEDLTFGLRVIAYGENEAFEKRISYNENASEIYIPPEHISDILTKHINLCSMFGMRYRIFERKEGYVVLATGKLSFLGIKIKTISELLLSKADAPMFRKLSNHRRIL